SRISTWVANIKSLFRPFLTLLLLGLSGAIIFELGPVDKPELLRYAEQIIFTSCTAISWWFGDRSFAPPSSK
ncbi:MAG: hypothetical protein OXC81_01510, partial [Betaproteobacteria bacterium]|nr:hypothetical protein [Betaproteobacteria bacterium]